MLKKNKALRALLQVSRPAFQITASMKASELALLVAGWQYVSESERPFVARRLASTVDPAVALAVGVTGAGYERLNDWSWMTGDNLATVAMPQPSATVCVRKARAITGFFGQLNDVYAMKLGDSPVKRIAFVGRWRVGGDWVVLQAEIIET